MTKKSMIFVLVLLLAGYTFAKVTGTYKMESEPNQGLAGNGITDIAPGANALWLGTGYGLSRTTDNGETFESFGPAQGIGRYSVSALWVSGDTIIVATAGDTLIESLDSYEDYGTGISISVDGGDSWDLLPQPPQDYTPVNNLSYDIAVHDGNIFLASFGGGLVKGSNFGESWEITTPDSFVFNPGGRLNHRVFSVLNASGVLWVGTAEGVNKSTDGGENWVNFNATNQDQPISGNWVIALAQQKIDDKELIWVCSNKAEGSDERYGVSVTENGGLTWKTTLLDIWATNFAFDGETVYVSTREGLFKSTDFGDTWYKFPDITDTITGDKVFTEQIYSVYADNGVLWVGTSDGLARTSDNGYTWDVNRAYVPSGKGDVPRTYAYPNPFSPTRYNLLDNDGHVRLQYNTKSAGNVTIRIFDFAMDLVTTIVENKYVADKGDYNEMWTGRNDYGDSVANGVYFYSVEIENDGTYWGKIMVVN